MSKHRHASLHALFAAVVALAATAVSAHSASDAYLTLDAQKVTDPSSGGNTVLHGQWDVALRDLNFVLGLDDDGDGNITWAELRQRQTRIADYVFAYLQVSGDGRACTINPTRQMVDNHADGGYAALFFDIVCSGRATRLTLDYRLFFAIDPSHRGILVLRSGADTATALLSPENARIELKL